MLNYSFKHTAFAYGKILAQLRAIAEDMAQTIASCHPLAVRNVKQAVIRGLELSLCQALELEKRLAGFKRPRSVLFVDALPYNQMGKVVKKELRETYGS